MDPVEIFKQRMQAAIKALPDNTPDARAAIYRKTREFVAFSRFANLGGALEEAIADIEDDFRPTPKEKEPQAEAVAPPTGRRARLAAAARERGQQAMAALGRLSPRMRLAIAGGAAAVLALAGAGFLLRTPPSDPDFDKGFADYSSSARGFEDIPAWTSYYAAGRDGDVTYVEAKGPAPLYSKQEFPVEEGKAYRMTVRLRVTVDDPAMGGSRFLVGTVPYDRRGKPIGAQIAPAQYFVMNAALFKAADGWKEGEGTIVWNGPDANASFPAGTVSVRLAIVMNYESPGAVAQIDYMRFEPAP